MYDYLLGGWWKRWKITAAIIVEKKLKDQLWAQAFVGQLLLFQTMKENFLWMQISPKLI